MNLKQIWGMVAVGAALSGAALAADSSATVVVRKNPVPMGVTPQVGYVKATATSGAASAGVYKYDVYYPLERKVVGCITSVRDVSGSLKLSGVNYSAASKGVVNVTVSSSIATSGTVATGDVAQTLCGYY